VRPVSDGGEELYERATAAAPRYATAGQLADALGLTAAALDRLFIEHGHETAAAHLRRISRPQPADCGPEFALPLPEGYRTREVIDFYARDPLSVCERVSPDGLDKCVLIEGRPALLEIRFAGDSAVCRTDAAHVPAARRAIERMLGIETDATEFETAFASDPLLGSLIARQRGLRIPLTPEPWEALAWAIMGQQISVAVAVTLRRRLIELAGEPHASGLRAHPPAAAVAKLEISSLRDLKFSGSKAEYILSAARAVVSGELPVSEMRTNLRNMSASRAARLAGAVRGVGPWTVQYFFLRGLGLSDCLPAGDAGLAQGIERLCGKRPTEAEVRTMMARYSPWRSLATYHIWASLKG
jgi:3-methyladenine DNA glycosylase/8-oxoguanine DNA glycosylase